MRLIGKDVVRTVINEQEDREFALEMRNKKSAIVGGVRGVEISAPDTILLRLIGGGALRFIGSRLCCTSFGNRSVEIEGRISTVDFEVAEE